MKKILLCMLAVMFVIFVGGCGKDNSNSSSSNPSVSSKPTFQGIAYNEEDIKTDDYFTTFSVGTISIRSRMKSERKEFLDEYYSTNKQVVDYDKWKKKVQTLLDDTNSMISEFNKMTPGENIKGEDLKKYNNAKSAAIDMLDCYAKYLNKSLSDIQSAQNKGTPIPYWLLCDNYLFQHGFAQANSKFLKNSGAFDNGLFCWLKDKVGNKKGFYFIPKLDIMISPFRSEYDYYGNTNELTATFVFLNRGMENFDMSKIKVTLTENNVVLEGDGNANNNYVKEMLQYSQGLGCTFATTGVFKPQSGDGNMKDFIVATYVFKPVSRGFSTDEGKYTAYFTITYDGQPILYTEYLDDVFITDTIN